MPSVLSDNALNALGLKKEVKTKFTCGDCGASGVSEIHRCKKQTPEEFLEEAETQIRAYIDNGGTFNTQVEGVKYDGDKLRFDLIDPEAMEALADVLTVGALKYSPNNWKRIEPLFDRYIAASLRHINARQKGEKYDPETGALHTSHLLTCVMFLVWGDLQENQMVIKPVREKFIKSLSKGNE